MSANLLYLFTYLIEAVALYYYCSSLFISKLSVKITCSIYVLSYLSMYLLSFFKSVPLNCTVTVLSTCFILCLVYNVKFYKSLFHSVIITGIMSLSEIIIIALFSNFNNYTLLENQNVTYLTILAITSKILYLLCLKLISSIMPVRLRTTQYKSTSAILLTIISMISLYIAATLTMFVLLIKMPITFRYILSSCAVLLLISNILFYYIHQHILKKNYEFTDMQIQLQKEYDMGLYYKTLFSQNENQRILIHDIRKHLTTLSDLNSKKDYIHIQKYLDTLLHSTALRASVQVSDNEMLNSILCHYLNLCYEKDISMNTDIRTNSLSNLEYADLTSLFGNLLDNAIDSCDNIPKSVIDLSISKPQTNVSLISLINTCITPPVFDANHMPISQKENKQYHGIGMKSIQKIVNKYNGNIKVYYEEEKHLFHTIIMICSK